MFRKRLRRLRVVAAITGIVAFVGGVVALFALDNSAGSIFLLTVGVVLSLVALLGERVELESFEILGARIKVREVVNSRLQLAERSVPGPQEPGGPDFHEQALTLRRLLSLYDLYAYVRSTQPFSDRRTATLDQIAIRMQRVGGEATFEPAEVSTWFHEGTDPLRVVALNLMLARKECRDFTAVLKCVDAPRSNFEQFYGLRLGHKMIPDLDQLERRLLADAIERAQRKRRFRRDRHLESLGKQILATLKTSESSGGAQRLPKV